jgi:formylglycine-generating enzyme required for sulfatase activity
VIAPPKKQVVKKTVAAMVLVPAGEFMMGTLHGSGFGNDQQHKVYLDAYYIDPYPVTFEEYDRYCDATGAKKPSDNGWGRGHRPVINVSWEEADQYARWAKKRLPTEAEYEKALRGGTQTEFFFGDTKDPLTNYAWVEKNSGKMTHPVGGKKPNPIGLYDMVGNVSEWCSDWYDPKYYATSPGKNPAGAAGSSTRVIRGGGWDKDSFFCRSALRSYAYPLVRNNSVGFRCARTP